MDLTSTNDYVGVLAFLLFLPVFIFCFVSPFCFLVLATRHFRYDVSVATSKFNICCDSNYNLLAVDELTFYLCIELRIMEPCIYIELGELRTNILLIFYYGHLKLLP